MSVDKKCGNPDASSCWEKMVYWRLEGNEVWFFETTGTKFEITSVIIAGKITKLVTTSLTSSKWEAPTCSE